MNVHMTEFPTAARPIPQVLGQFLARTRQPPWKRANLAKAIIDRRAEVTDLTPSQIARLCRASLYRVNGKRHRESKPSLADHLRRATVDELIEAARTVGVDWVWDSMIMPIVSEEREGQYHD